MPSSETKRCTRCGQVKTLDQFYTERKRRADGSIYEFHRSVCRTCHYETNKAARERLRTVQADDRPAKKTRSTSETGYHFDTRFLRRLARIAQVLHNERLRSRQAASSTDTQTLTAAGMRPNDVQILRKAISTQDDKLCHYIFDEPLPERIIKLVSPSVPPEFNSSITIAAQVDSVPETAQATPTRLRVSDDELAELATTFLQLTNKLRELEPNLIAARDMLRELEAQHAELIAERDSVRVKLTQS